jgi:filamentous hemagglutinin
VEYIDIISRSVQILGEISSVNEVNLITGRNDYDYNTGIATKKADDGSSKPELAIDAAALGSISSGRIRIIANEDGVGVKTHSTLTSNSDDIIISASGKVEVMNVNSANDVQITGSFSK